jgi:lysozyme
VVAVLVAVLGVPALSASAGPAPATASAPTTVPPSPPRAVAPWPRLGAGDSYGVDVSSYQGRVNWPALAAQGVAFAYVKATEGTGYVNPYFRYDWTAAASAGVPHGAYQFFSLCEDGKAQAEAFLATVPRGPGSLPPALDLEMAGNCSSKVPARKVAANIAKFVRTVETATGQPVIYYVGDDFSLRYRLDTLEGCPLWLDSPIKPLWSGVVIWQPSTPVTATGVAGSVDLDEAAVASLRALPTHQECHLLELAPRRTAAPSSSARSAVAAPTGPARSGR